MTETIPERMQAVVMHGPADYRFEEVEVPSPGPGDLLIRVDAVGVCGSDLKCFHGAAKFWGDDSRSAWAEHGRIPGHEITGTVVAGDDEARAHHAVADGDRIVCEQIVPCEQCRYCRRGQYWMCAPHDMFGFRGFDGAMAQYMLVPLRARVHPVSADVKPHHAAYAEPLSCALHAVDLAAIQFGDVVVVAGCGPIGLGLVAGARQKNPMTLVAIDLTDEKLETAKRCGADVVVNASREDPVEIVRGLTEGYGADVYLEGTGATPAVGQGLTLLRKLGRYVEYSVFGSEVTVDWSIISDDKELTVQGAHLGPHCWPAAIKLIETAAIPMDAICTDQFPLADFTRAFELVEDSSGASVKVTLLPHG